MTREKNEKRETGPRPAEAWVHGRGRAGEGRGGGVFIAICTIHQRRTNELLCVIFPHEGTSKHDMLQVLFKTYDTTYQHFQGQEPALSYELIRALQCNLFSKYHSSLQKEQKHEQERRPGQSLPQSVGIICPWNQLILQGKHTHTHTHTRMRACTHAHTHTHKYIPCTHIHVNHEN